MKQINNCLRFGLLVLLFFAANNALQAQVSASFGYTVLVPTSCVPASAIDLVRLDDTSEGNIASREWWTDQPDVAKLSVTFPTAPRMAFDLSRQDLPEEVKVTLVVHDSTGGSDTASVTIPTDFHFAPVVDFTPAFHTEGCVPLELYLKHQSFSVHGTPLVSFEWDFGDGKNSTGPETEHVYNNIGNYTLTLKVTDEQGCEGGAEDTDIRMKVVVLDPASCK